MINHVSEQLLYFSDSVEIYARQRLADLAVQPGPGETCQVESSIQDLIEGGVYNALSVRGDQQRLGRLLDFIAVSIKSDKARLLECSSPESIADTLDRAARLMGGYMLAYGLVDRPDEDSPLRLMSHSS